MTTAEEVERAAARMIETVKELRSQVGLEIDREEGLT
jgi:hypothetical protein